MDIQSVWFYKSILGKERDYMLFLIEHKDKKENPKTSAIVSAFFEPHARDIYEFIVKIEEEDIVNIYELGEDFVDRPVYIEVNRFDEFLGYSLDSEFTETELETSIINNLQKFLMELRKRLCFCGKTTAYSYGEGRLLYRFSFLQLYFKMFRVN